MYVQVNVDGSVGFYKKVHTDHKRNLICIDKS